MYSKNEAILDLKNILFFFFFQNIDFFQKVETDHPASRLAIQPV